MKKNYFKPVTTEIEIHVDTVMQTMSFTEEPGPSATKKETSGAWGNIWGN